MIDNAYKDKLEAKKERFEAKVKEFKAKVKEAGADGRIFIKGKIREIKARTK